MIAEFEKTLRVVNSYWHHYKYNKLQYNPGQLKALQSSRFMKLISIGSKNVKFYREAFEYANLNIEEINSIDDLSRLPIITKIDMKERFWDFLPSEIPASRVRRTSGSTGEPLCVLSDHDSRMLNSAAILRYRKALGISPYFGDILVPLKSPYEQPYKRSHWTFLQGLHKTHYVNPYIMNEVTINRFARLAKKLKNFSIIGITPGIKALALAIKDSKLPPIKPKVVIPVGQLLTSKTRALFEEVFATCIADLYACSECGDVAWQCPSSKQYHINAENIVLEVLKDGTPAGPGEIGEVVLTSLTRYAMPIIRYKNGDLARVPCSQCDCGRILPTISEIIGRTGDDIVLPDGSKILWNNIKGLMNHPHIRRFQIIQTSQGNLEINYIPEPRACNEDLVKHLSEKFTSVIPRDLKLNFNRVDSITPEKSGKFKLVKSEYQQT